MKKTKLVVVVGPTASGKTKLAIHLAKACNGEIISADSMQIYRDMTIATAKPTQEEQEGIVHHLIDFLPPEESFSVSEYVQKAREAIEDITARGKLPIIAGGTGLYVQSLVNHIDFSQTEQNEVLRTELYAQAKIDGGKSLYEYLKSVDSEAAESIHPNNLVRVVRAVEVYKTTGKTMTEQKKESRKTPSPYDVCMIGINYHNREELYRRIDLRVDFMMEAGLLEEAKEILKRPNLKTAYNAIGYKELAPYFSGDKTLEACLECMKQESRRYAKRQLTWFRRDERIHWFYPDEAGGFEEVTKKSQKLIESFTIV